MPATATKPSKAKSNKILKRPRNQRSQGRQKSKETPNRYVPTTLTPDWIHGFHKEAVEKHIERLGKYLLHERELPNFYFRQALIEEGIDNIRAARWDPSKWVSPNGKVNIADYNYRLLILTTFIKVNRYIANEPTGETYGQAMRRLKQRVQQIIETKISRAEIAKRLDINPKTVNFILRGETKTRTRVCPWELHRKIENTDWTPIPRAYNRGRKHKEPPTPHSLTDTEVSHARAKDRAAKQISKYRRQYLKIGGTCWKCEASFTHLRAEGLPENRVQELVCRMCGSSSFIRTSSASNR